MTSSLRLVSIIIPVYNAELFIKDCLKSIYEQTYPEIEIIIVNDGSTDGSLKICRAFAESNVRVKLINKENTGVSDTRNIGIDSSNGDYIVFVDSDDTISPDAIEILVNAIEKSEKVGAVFGKHAYQYGKKILVRSTKLPKGIYETKKLNEIFWDDGTLSGILFGSVCGAIYRTSIIKKHNLSFEREVTVNEDGLFNLQYFQYVQNIENIEDTTYIYRQWKNRKSIDIVEMCHKYTIVDEKIQEVLSSQISDDNLNKQMNTRKIFIVFQISVLICENNSFFVSNKQLRQLWKANNLNKKLLRNLKCDDMNVYKRILAKMMENHLAICFYLVIHYIYPCLKRFIKR